MNIDQSEIEHLAALTRQADAQTRYLTYKAFLVMLVCAAIVGAGITAIVGFVAKAF